MHWAADRRPELVAQLVVDLYQYWFARGLLREARDLLDSPLAESEAIPEDVWARAAARAAWFDTELGRLDDAGKLAEAAADVFRRLGDGVWLQRTLGATIFLNLIHKAVGWMLREVGKRDLPAQEAFLAANYRRMPRTALRYAIERLPEPRRRQYLRGEV